MDKFDNNKLLTDKDKENITLANNTNESSKLIKLNDNFFFNNNQNSNIIFNNSQSHSYRADLFAQKMGRLIKKKNISLISDKDMNSKNLIISKNEKNENSIANNTNNLNLNNMHYKKNSVLRQFNSKKDFNYNISKNNILYNFNNISNNSINSSSSSLNNLNKKKYKFSSNQISQNNSINKNRKSSQKINLNLNLQINFNININKKNNKKLILGNRINHKKIDEVNNKNDGCQHNKGNNSLSNNINIPLTQRCYYNINNNSHKFLGSYRSSSSSNSKKKLKNKN